jgi:GNAT superfamily N-acetyltransferase
MDPIAVMEFTESMVSLELLTPTTFNEYCSLGIKAYQEHYLHLWPNSDASAYIEGSFTSELLKTEKSDPNAFHYIIRKGATGIGILKLLKDKGIDAYPAKSSLLLEKIYLLKDHTGQGYGKDVLKLVEAYALSIHKRFLWLDTMKKGPALSFYCTNGFRIIGEKELPFENAKPEEKGMYILVKEL